MSALTGPRHTKFMGRQNPQLPMDVAADTSIYVGALVARDSAGDACPGQLIGSSPLDDLKIMGIADGVYLGFPGQSALNVAGAVVPGSNNRAAGAAGAIKVTFSSGIVLLDINASSIDKTKVGKLSYAVDDHTVDDDNGSSTRPVCGRIKGLEGTTQVWVDLEDQAD